MVTRVAPAAIQRGQTTEIVISGVHNFAGASGMLFEGKGLSAEILGIETPPATPQKKRGRRDATSTVRAKITASPEAHLGPRELRVVTAQGVSSIGMIVVVAEPVTAEENDKSNDELKGAQAITLPTAVAGTIGKAEDVDWYAFDAKAGERVTFSLWGNRLEDKIHDLQTHLDPILVLCDAQGRELAVNDNQLFADPLLSYAFKDAGRYYLQIRDTTYSGNPNWSYVMIATAGPFATAAYPLTVRPGSRAELTATGFNFDVKQSMGLDVPKDFALGPIALALPAAEGATPPVPLAATDLPIALEAGDAASESVRGQMIAVPAALNGRLEAMNDIDAYQFTAAKGKTYTFEMLARRVGSAADPVLRITDVKGRVLTEADDTFGKDPRVDWTAPNDANYVLQVTDLHSRGGEGYGYVILAREAKPDFMLSCDPDKANIGPGCRTAIFARVDRRPGFAGPIAVAFESLPPGVSASPLTIPASMTQGVIVLSAAPNAEKTSALLNLQGKAETSEGAIVRPATPRQEIYLPGGGRGLFNVATMALAVTDPSDITLDAGSKEITVQPGSEATIEVSVTRREGFEQPVNLALDLSHLGQVFASALPPGVRLKEESSKTLLDPKTTTGKLIIEAKPDAPPCDKVPIAVMGHVSINFVVKTAYSTAPILLTIPAKSAAK
jgi:hypothetical protein